MSGLNKEQQQELIKQLEERLEIPEHGNYDGISCRDETIKQLERQLAKRNKRIEQLEKERDELHSMIVHTGKTMPESEGVAGYHLNGDIADWDDLFDGDFFKDALVKRDIKQQVKGVERAYSEIADLHNSDYVKLKYFAKKLRNQLGDSDE